VLGTRLPYGDASLTVGATIVVWREEMVADRVPHGGRRGPPAWHGSWHGAPGSSSSASAISAIGRVIGAARAFSARGRTYGKEKVYPLTLVTRFSLDRKTVHGHEKASKDTDGVLLIRA
jgi:hypothetical protein